MKYVARAAAVCALALSVTSLCAEDEVVQPKLRHIVIGARYQMFPYSQFKTNSTEATTTKPVAQYDYTGSSTASRRVPSVSIEYRITRRLSVGADLVLDKVQFTQNASMLSGIADPNASVDDRKSTSIVQETRADYWEIPILARYHFFAEHGVLAHTYAGGGLAYRRVWRVRTTTSYTYPDGSTGTDYTAITPANTNQFGAVAAAGMRFVDPVGVKVMPEVRFIRWDGFSFQGGGYRSARNELTVGLGLSF